MPLQRTRWPAAMAGLLLLATANPGMAFVATIGHSADCQYRTGPGLNPLQQAVNAGATDIRLQEGVIGDKTVSIHARSLSIQGGYADCAAAAAGTAPAPLARSVLLVDPASGNRPLSITTTAAGGAQAVQLRQLRLTDQRGLRPVLPVSGGGLFAFGQLELLLADSELVALDASRNGGAIATVGGVWLTLRNSRIVASHAYGNGGGIHCANGRVELDAGSLLLGNRALGDLDDDAGDGGAIHAADCPLQIHARAHPDTPSAEITAGIVDNRANRHGGGIHAERSEVRLIGGRFCPPAGACPNLPVLLRGNRADADVDRRGDGGALHLHDSPLHARHFVIAGNRAVSGGAIASSRSVASQRQQSYLGEHAAGVNHPAECWHPDRCNWLVDNVAKSEIGAVGLGGALRLRGSTFYLNRVRAEGNTADHGTFAHLSEDGGSLFAASSVFTANSSAAHPSIDWFLVSVGDFVRFEAYASTFVDNDVRAGMIWLDRFGGTRLIGNVLQTTASEPFVIGSNGFQPGHCNVADRDIALVEPPLITDDFRFVDAAAGNFRLRRDSPARDVCSVVPNADTDFDWRPRGIALAPGAAPFDAGAFETLDGERLFADGFWRPTP